MSFFGNETRNFHHNICRDPKLYCFFYRNILKSMYDALNSQENTKNLVNVATKYIYGLTIIHLLYLVPKLNVWRGFYIK